VILHFQTVVIFQEVKAAAGDSTRCPSRACEEICQLLVGVEAGAVEGVEAEREEVGAQQAASVDDGAPVLADAA